MVSNFISVNPIIKKFYPQLILLWISSILSSSCCESVLPSVLPAVSQFYHQFFLLCFSSTLNSSCCVSVLSSILPAVSFLSSVLPAVCHFYPQFFLLWVSSILHSSCCESVLFSVLPAVSQFYSLCDLSQFFLVWVLMCLFLSDIDINVLSHTGQAYGLSPVCILLCTLRCQEYWNVLSQTSHWWGLSGCNLCLCGKMEDCDMPKFGYDKSPVFRFPISIISWWACKPEMRQTHTVSFGVKIFLHIVLYLFYYSDIVHLCNTWTWCCAKYCAVPSHIRTY